ncbi:type VI secretion system baseplate subunit TssG [Zoogloea dura]|jgi:type VI secretion system protein ImpH|uniref:Type VI secretion system baseplate subunit TssG n=1 Tax=Zoogloea dura TaxID=2728840 RepID=A0A848G510_9RHOO|nr:type VI secretion system baseplate subunit TssG [Zoogloea dura]NML24761.1 type VI secretion system baseplate subunit TssG [Zoogloea dura]
MRASPDLLSLLESMTREPWAWDFYQALRRLDAANADAPRIGFGRSPAEEPVRLGQDPDLSFAPASLAAVAPPKGRRPNRLDVRFFGMLGPNGPLPRHLTEHARNRLLHGGDASFARFLDVFHHRFLSLFYRAWAQAQPTVSLDRPEDDPFGRYLGALAGIGLSEQRDRDALPDFAKLAHTGHLSRQVRNGEGLAKLVAAYFRCEVQVEQFVGHWIVLEEGDRLMLGTGRQALGQGAVVGARVWDRQHKFRLRIGPLGGASYDALLPAGSGIRALAACVHNYVNMEYFWDVRLVLKAADVPLARLDGRVRLGYTAWLGGRDSSRHADDLVLDVERVLGRPASRSGGSTPQGAVADRFPAAQSA